MFKIIPEATTLLQEDEESEKGKDIESQIDVKEEKVSPISATGTTKTTLLNYTARIWKKIGTILTILFTILIALSINALIQTILQGISPTKEYSGIVLVILSQTAYLIVVTIGLISALLFVGHQEYKNKQEQEQAKGSK